MRNLFALFALSIIVCDCGGCSPTKTTCFESVYIPRGEYIAQACTYDTVGPGINNLGTEITIRSADESGKGAVTLSFDNESTASHKPVQFALLWHSPDRLEVLFSETPKFTVHREQYKGAVVTTSLR
jgi:hypothetical protein